MVGIDDYTAIKFWGQAYLLLNLLLLKMVKTRVADLKLVILNPDLDPTCRVITDPDHLRI